MEPCTISIGIAAAGIFAASALAASERLPGEVRLHEVVAEGSDSDEMVFVQIVHLRRVELASQWRGKTLGLSIKYGEKGKSLRCNAGEFSPALPVGHFFSHHGWHKRDTVASAEPESCCLFLHSKNIAPVMRVKVHKTGSLLGRCAVAKADFTLEAFNGRGEAELQLRGIDSAVVGRVFIIVDVLSVRKQDLANSLSFALAQKQKDAYVLSAAAPTVLGILTKDGATDKLGEFERGLAKECKPLPSVDTSLDMASTVASIASMSSESDDGMTSADLDGQEQEEFATRFGEAPANP
mmetsp:Transcript_68225/g.177149  ORF Transcript_68225/g.177149 Transcript_68225/m.177149 type:complete len:295 (+) Transcript_68225:97-981(+)